MDKRVAGVQEQADFASNALDQWQALNDLELASVGGGIGDTVL
jgi:hypothetical protein